MPNLIGTAPDQVPVNGFLGNMAFQNKEGVIVNLLSTTALTVTGTGVMSVGGTQFVKDASGDVGIGNTPSGAKLDVSGLIRSRTGAATTDVNHDGTNGSLTSSSSLLLYANGANPIILHTNATERMRITSAGYLEATYSDKVVALGNSGTATTINLDQGNVFTATLTGNCTFTLAGSNANSSRGSSFTLILTNDGTAGRTVAWAGGTFRFPGGAASLSRTTTANAVDIWVFFTPDNGTTWYGNISMKNMIA